MSDQLSPLRELREARGLTVVEAAGRAVVGKAYWQDIEHGRRPLPVGDTGARIAVALKVRHADLVGLDVVHRSRVAAKALVEAQSAGDAAYKALTAAGGARVARKSATRLLEIADWSPVDAAIRSQARVLAEEILGVLDGPEAAEAALKQLDDGRDAHGRKRETSTSSERDAVGRSQKEEPVRERDGFGRRR